jgi:hypothetical protein
VKLLALGALLCALASPALGQVGHLPSQSPFHDQPYKQELTVYGGYFSGAKGAAGVGPRASAITGVRYAIRLGGPVDLHAHLARAWSDRLVIDPAQPAVARNLGIVSAPLYLADLGIALNLTGQKSYHRLMPAIGFGVGLASALGEDTDLGGYKFGTPFALTFGGALRYVPGGSVSLRLDVADYLYQLSYPASYFATPEGGGEPVLPATQSTSQWKHNAVLTLGVSYLFSR